MRSRFSAFALGDVQYLLDSWHPRTRPPELVLDSTQRWYRLDIIATHAGGHDDVSGTVEFEAFYRSGTDASSQHEISRFVQQKDRWYYVEAE